MNRKLIFGILICLLLPSGPLLADENYVHKFTGFTFPPSVTAFLRVKITPYNQAQSDIEVDYNNKPYTVHLSAYVYPAHEPLQTHYEKCKADVMQVHPDARLLEENPITTNKSGVDYHGFSALYAFRGKFVGDTDQDLLSRLIIYRRDDYYVLFRISYAASDKKDAEEKITDFLDQFAWPPGGTDASGIK